MGVAKERFMQSIIAALVLMSGSLVGVGNVGGGSGGEQPGGASTDKKVMTANDILSITDEKLVPVWAVKPADRNAGLLYLRAALDYSREARSAVLDVSWNDVGSIVDSSKMPAPFTAASKAVRAGSSQWIQDAIAASKLKTCSFECAYEGGVGMLLPHLSHLRAMARGLRVEARTLLIEGKRDEAAAIAAALIRMGTHATSDRVIISSLVGIAISVQGADEAAVILASGELSPQAAEDLRGAIRDALAGDAFRCKEAIGSERDLMLEWLRIAAAKSSDAIKVMAALQGSELRPEVKEKLSNLGASGLEDEIAKARKAFGLVIDAWDAADSATRLAKISDAISSGEHGVVTQICVPPFLKSNKALADVVTRLKAAEAKLPAQR